MLPQSNYRSVSKAHNAYVFAAEMTARSDYEHMLDAVRRQLHRNPQVTAVQQRMMSLNPGL